MNHRVLRSSLLSSFGRTARRALLGAAVGLAGAASAWASHTAADWFDSQCAAGQYLRCWQPIPNANNPVRDKTAAQGDATKATTPNPSSADIFSGTSGNLNSVYFGYDDRGTTSADDDVMFFRMRLLDTPGIGGAPPGNQVDGPYDANTTWNFVLDIDGDGWVDFVNTTDGKSGKNNPTSENYDDMFLGLNPSNARQDLTNLSGCSAGGQVLWKHDSIDPANDSCTSNTAIPCDFKYTRIVNDTANNGGYFLDMQFPLYIFDSCTGADSDGDGIGGSQLLMPTTTFTFCATTSTQPQDPSNKDLGGNGTYSMSNSRRLPCGDNCSLAGGCVQPPALVDLTHTCGAGTNASPITLTATVMDTLFPNAGGTDVVDSIADVKFYYRQINNPNWTLAGAATGSANPVTSPNSGTTNIWSMQWNTSALPTTPTPDYLIRIDATDDDGNVTSKIPLRINLTTCSVTSTPVTLAWFKAGRDGGAVRLDWATATEAGNVGFNLYAQTAAGWRKLNRELIPSGRVDSVEPQEYRFDVPAGQVAGREIWLEDVDVQGRTKLHGPFGLSGEQGLRPTPEPVDWKAIRAEHQAQAKARAAAWRARGRGLAKAAGTAAAFPTAQLAVRRDGIYRVTYEALAAAGFDFAGAPARDLALTHRGVPEPIYVSAPADVFGPGAFFEFRGRALDTLYTDANVYRLEVDGGRAERIRSANTPLKPGTPAPYYMETVTVERNRAYSFGSPNGDPWYDTAMLAFTSPREWSFDLTVDALVAGAAGAAPATLAVSMWGVTGWPQNPDHHVIVRVNGAAVADEVFDGLVDHPVSVQLPPGLVREGANTLTLALPGDTGVSHDLVSLESYALTYPRAFVAREGRLTFQAAGRLFRVSGLTGPEVAAYCTGEGRLTRLEKVEVAAAGGSWTATFPGSGKPETCWVVSAGAYLTPQIAPARDEAAVAAITEGTAQYLVISHPDFLVGLGPLVAERQAQGLSVRVVDVEDVYARFGHGIFDAAAIRDYVAWAIAHMGTEYVLLVGGDTYDYRNFLGQGSMSFLPSLYAPTGPLVRFAPVDPLYTDVDRDGVPDAAIGRLPVRTAAELDAAVAKTLTYARKDYGRTAVFAADRFDPDANVDFDAISDRFAGALPAGWSVRRAYLDASGVAGAKSELLAAIGGGVALTSFIGHSGPTVWTFSGLFHANEVAALANAGRPTVVVQWGCWNTYYVAPGANTLGHKLLLSGDRGAAAVLGATTLTEVESDRALGVLLSPRLSQPGMTIGKAILAAKRELARTQPGLADVLIGWTVLGDPALSVEP